MEEHNSITIAVGINYDALFKRKWLRKTLLIISNIKHNEKV